MSATSVSSMAGELNQAMLASWVEKPPRPTAEKAWQMASNQDMPHTRSATIAGDGEQRVHEPQRLGGLGDARRELLVLDRRPASRPLYSCMPPTPSSGSTASAMHDDRQAAEPVQRVRARS